MQVAIIDERDCFELLRGFEVGDLVERHYLIATSPDYYESMVELGRATDLTIVHRHIWIDDCHKDDPPCQGILSELRLAIAPSPMLEVGNYNTTHDSCPEEMYSVFVEIYDAYVRLEGLIGAKVLPVNPRWNTPYLTIKSMEVLGDNSVGTVLEMPITKEKKKFCKLTELQKYVQ